MADERAETLSREAEVINTNTPPKEIGGKPQVTAAVTKEPTHQETGDGEEEIPVTPMIPKFRYDELNQKYQSLKNQPKAESPAAVPDLDRLVEAKIAPFRVQMETDRVMKTYDDFPSFANDALKEIEKNPTLSLEDGYILAKAKSGALKSEATEQGKNEAYNTIQRKQSTQGVTSGRKAEPRSVDDLLRDPTVSLKDIEKMLPKS